MTYTFNLLEIILIPIFIILFTVLIMIQSKEKKLSAIDIFYKITASILTVMLGSFIIVIMLFLFTDLAVIDETKKTLDAHTKIFFSFITPTGIMLSAALASLSVLKSINNTNMIEKRKEEKEKEETKIRLEFHLLNLNQLLSDINKSDMAVDTTFIIPIIKEIFKDIESDKKIISQYSTTGIHKIFHQLRVLIISNTLLKDTISAEEIRKQLNLTEKNIQAFAEENQFNYMKR